MVIGSSSSGPDCSDFATEDLFFFFGEFSWLDASLLHYI